MIFLITINKAATSVESLDQLSAKTVPREASTAPQATAGCAASRVSHQTDCCCCACDTYPQRRQQSDEAHIHSFRQAGTQKTFA